MIHLVTGGAGFIGSNLVRALLDRGDEVRVIDNLSTGRAENLKGLELEFLLGSILEGHPLHRLMLGVDTVFHLAAQVSASESISHPNHAHRVNVSGTRNILHTAEQAGVRKVVLSSSCAVYGTPAQTPTPESHPARPQSPYAESKLHAEQLLLSHPYLDTVALRYFNVYGPHQSPTSSYSAVVPAFLQAALLRDPIVLEGDGTQSRDFVFVSDVVQANLLAAKAATFPGEVFNVGTGLETTLLELLCVIEHLFDFPIQVRYAKGREKDLPRSVAGLTQVQKRLGFRPSVMLYDGLSKTLDWMRSP